MSEKTPGEILFEEYLRLAGITDFVFERRLPESSKTPDYSFTHNGSLVLLDVKDFRWKPEDFKTGFRFYDPYGRIREKINEGSRKFKDLKAYPCALVLYNHDKPLVSLRPMFVYGAMLGNLGFQIPLNSKTGIGDRDRTRTVFVGGGKMVRYGRDQRPMAPQNRTISAVIAVGQLLVGQKLCMAWLKKEEERLGHKMTFEESLAAIETCRGTDKDICRTELRVIVYENPYARITWPKDLFTAAWDERYGLVDHYIRRISAGEALLEWERLTGEVAEFSSQTQRNGKQT
jgi:hypothetical protein